MIENGRLKEIDIPDDYQWLVETLTELASMPINQKKAGEDYEYNES